MMSSSCCRDHVKPHSTSCHLLYPLFSPPPSPISWLHLHPATGSRQPHVTVLYTLPSWPWDQPSNPATRHTPRDQSILRGPFEYFPNEDGIIKLSSFPYIYGRQKDHKVMKHDKLFSFLHPQRKIRAEKPRAVRTVEGCQRLLNTPSFSRFQQTCLTWILCVTQCYYRNGLLFFLPHSFPILGNPSSPLIKSAILFLLFGQWVHIQEVRFPLSCCAVIFLAVEKATLQWALFFWCFIMWRNQ